MAGREVSIVIFYDKDKNIAVQERRSLSKLGEIYGYFGGGVEPGENPEQALRRELTEELGYVPEELEFWTDHSFYLIEEKYKDWLIQCHAFLSPITDKLKNTTPVEDCGITIMNIADAKVDSGFYYGDIDLLVKLDEELNRRLSCV